MLCCPCFPVLVFGWSESSKCDPTGNLERCCKQKDKGFQIYISLGHIFSLSNRYLELLFRSMWPIGQLFSFMFSQKLACLYLSILEHDRIINAWEVHHARFEGFFCPTWNPPWQMLLCAGSFSILQGIGSRSLYLSIERRHYQRLPAVNCVTVKKTNAATTVFAQVRSIAAPLFCL